MWDHIVDIQLSVHAGKTDTNNLAVYSYSNGRTSEVLTTGRLFFVRQIMLLKNTMAQTVTLLTNICKIASWNLGGIL